MRFRMIDKILLVILLLFITILAFGLFGIATDLITQDMLLDAVVTMTNGMIENALILAAIGLLLLVFVIRLFIAMGKKRDHADGGAIKQPTSALLLEGEGGSAYIALTAIDAMVQRHCRNNSKVKECESTISAVDSGVTISLKLSALNETVVPELAAELQKSLKEYVETLSGIHVKEINILVVHAPVTAKPRMQ